MNHLLELVPSGRRGERSRRHRRCKSSADTVALWFLGHGGTRGKLLAKLGELSERIVPGGREQGFADSDGMPLQFERLACEV